MPVAFGCYRRSRSSCIGPDGWQEPLRGATERRKENRADVILDNLHAEEKTTPMIVAMRDGRTDAWKVKRTGYAPA